MVLFRGSFSKGGEAMFFSEFCDMIQPTWLGCSSQAQYLKGLFNAASINRVYSDEHLRAIYSGKKPFNSNMKKCFPRPVDEVKIASYFESHIQADKVDTLIDAFAVPMNLERNKTYLCVALAKQVATFIRCKDEDADCIIVAAYKTAIITEASAHYEIPKRLYACDDLYVDQKDKRHEVGCYQRFRHEWSIQNRGQCLWSGRKLVCVNQSAIKPQFGSLTIDIPNAKPYEFIKIATEVDSRGIEGSYSCVWEMQDSEGNNCFPDSRLVFDFTINVTFKI